MRHVHLAFHMYVDAVMKEVKRRRERKRLKSLEECRIYTDYLLLCDESGEDLKVIVGRFVEL